MRPPSPACRAATLAATFSSALACCTCADDPPPRELGRAPGPEVRHVFHGAAPDDAFGTSVTGCGDLDGDGRGDLLVGAIYADADGAGEDAGRAAVLSGADGRPIHELQGDGPHFELGYSVAALADLDDDGLPDFAVGFGESGRTGLGPGGGVRVYSGADAHELFTVLGDGEVDRFALAIADAGDTNADGVHDLIVGAPAMYSGNAPGYARIVSGKDGAVLLTLSGDGFDGDRFGYTVDGVGDVNGDGHADVIVGSIGARRQGEHAGAAFLFSGRDGALLRRFDGDVERDELGHGVAGPGDLDGDGVPDVVLAAFHSNGLGYVRAFDGKAGRLLWGAAAEVAGDGFGHDLATAGDVDGDGVDDLVVGASGGVTEGLVNAGYLRIVSGRDGSELRTFRGDRERLYLGYHVGGAGDVNADGFADVIGGTQIQDGHPGRAYVVSAFDVKVLEGDAPLRLHWRTRRVEGRPVAVFVTVEGDTSSGALRLVALSERPAAGATPRTGSALFVTPVAADAHSVPLAVRRPELPDAPVFLYVAEEADGALELRSNPLRVLFAR